MGLVDAVAAEATANAQAVTISQTLGAQTAAATANTQTVTISQRLYAAAAVAAAPVVYPTINTAASGAPGVITAVAATATATAGEYYVVTTLHADAAEATAGETSHTVTVPGTFSVTVACVAASAMGDYTVHEIAGVVVSPTVLAVAAEATAGTILHRVGQRRRLEYEVELYLSGGWTDVTPYVLDRGVTITRGRRSTLSDVDTGTATVRLDNSDGRFSPAPGAVVDIARGQRVRISALLNGRPWRRFDGYATAWTESWEGRGRGVVQLAASDRLWRLALGAQSKWSIYEAAVDADEPVAWWTCDVPSGGTRSANRGSASRPALVGASSSTGPGFDGAGCLGVEARVSSGATASPNTVEFWAAIDGETLSGTEAILVNTHSDGETMAAVRVTAGGYAQLFARSTADSGGWEWEGDTEVFVADGAWHHYVVRQSSTLFQLWVDGEYQRGRSGIGEVPTYGPHFPPQSYLSNVRVAQVAVYDTYLSDTQVADHYEAMTGLVERSDERVVRLLSYAGYYTSPDALSDCLSDVGPQPTKGVDLLGALKQVAAVELADLYADRDGGALVFRGRGGRYNPTAAYVLDAASDVLRGGVVQRYDMDLMASAGNDLTASTYTGEDVAYTSTTLTGTYGTYTRSLGALPAADGDRLYELLAWTVNAWSGDVPPHPDQLTVELAAASDTLVADLLDTDIGTCISVTGIPQGTGSTSVLLHVDGYTETWRGNSHRITLTTAPATPWRVLALDTTPAGRLDTGYPIAY